MTNQTIVLTNGDKFTKQTTRKPAPNTYKEMKTGFLFNNSRGEAFLFLVSNQYNEKFFVSCSRTDSGRIRYMFSTDSTADKMLGDRKAQNTLIDTIFKTLSQPKAA